MKDALAVRATENFNYVKGRTMCNMSLSEGETKTRNVEKGRLDGDQRKGIFFCCLFSSLKKRDARDDMSFWWGQDGEKESK